MTKRLKKTLSSRSGMTLVELMVTLLLVVLVLTVIGSFFGFVAKLYKSSDDLSARQDQARLIVNGLRNRLDKSLDLSILSSAPADFPAGYLAIYVSDGRLVCRSSDGTLEQVFTNVKFDTLAVDFSSDDPSLLHVEVFIDGEKLAQTDILLVNTAITPAASGSALLYLPAN